ncbi:hypothetical protein LEP1GSC088_0807 [Leptospira interrogans str. L1207]|nr:hypothetical protein LEP1GSC088_0807 [Leptospira interrogans str. L1207]
MNTIFHIIITVFGLSGILFLVCKTQDTHFIGISETKLQNKELF